MWWRPLVSSDTSWFKVPICAERTQGLVVLLFLPSHRENMVKFAKTASKYNESDRLLRFMSRYNFPATSRKRTKQFIVPSTTVKSRGTLTAGQWRKYGRKEKRKLGTRRWTKREKGPEKSWVVIIRISFSQHSWQASAQRKCPTDELIWTSDSTDLGPSGCSTSTCFGSIYVQIKSAGSDWDTRQELDLTVIQIQILLMVLLVFYEGA